MSDMENMEQRLGQIEQKVDQLLSRQSQVWGEDHSAAVPKRHSHTGRIFLGFLIVIISLVWMGQNFGIDWLGKLKILPLVLIAFGLYLAFGGRDG